MAKALNRTFVEYPVKDARCPIAFVVTAAALRMPLLCEEGHSNIERQKLSVTL